MPPAVPFPERRESGVRTGWEETEECIDPQSGLLQVHSEVPGRYAVYDYTNAPQLAGHILPRSVTITEAGRIVSKISVESLSGLTAADPNLFVPTDAMKAKGRAVAMTSATKISRIQGQGPFTSAVTIRPVCVFGMVTPSGQLVEAHSLQPSDPNSEAAVEDAKEDRLLSADARRSAATAAFCLRDREVCFPAIVGRPTFLLERDVRRRLEVPVILVLDFHPVPRAFGVAHQEVDADGQ